MKSIFDPTVREEIITRIQSLTPAHKALWGKMTVEQMVRHCTLCEAYYAGHVPVKRSFFGRIFGKMAMRSILKNNESGLGKNAPTPEPFRVIETITDLEKEKQAWISELKHYEKSGGDEFTHWFFGRMSQTELGCFIYKHDDHHLRQFGV